MNIGRLPTWTLRRQQRERLETKARGWEATNAVELGSSSYYFPRILLIRSFIECCAQCVLVMCQMLAAADIEFLIAHSLHSTMLTSQPRNLSFSQFSHNKIRKQSLDVMERLWWKCYTHRHFFQHFSDLNIAFKDWEQLLSHQEGLDLIAKWKLFSLQLFHVQLTVAVG